MGFQVALKYLQAAGDQLRMIHTTEDLQLTTMSGKSCGRTIRLITEISTTLQLIRVWKTNYKSLYKIRPKKLNLEQNYYNIRVIFYDDLKVIQIF